MKHAGEIVNVLEAYELVGTLSGVARLAGCDKNTVKHYVDRRAAGADPWTGLAQRRWTYRASTASPDGG